MIVVNPLKLGVLKSFDIKERKELLEDVLFIPRDRYDIYSFVPGFIFSSILTTFIFRRTEFFFSKYFDSWVLLELVEFSYFVFLGIVSYVLFINIVLRLLLYFRVAYLNRVNRR